MAPTSDGGAPITGYRVLVNPGGQTFALGPTTLAQRVPGLAGGVPYMFSVVAVNDAGDSVPAVTLGSTGLSFRIIGADGHVATFGSEPGFAGITAPNQPLVGGADTADGQGYWMVASDGGIFSFGDAGFLGSTAGAGSTAAALIL